MAHQVIRRDSCYLGRSLLLRVDEGDALVGYRAWAVTETGLLAGYFRGTPWRPGAVERTRCSPHRSPLPPTCRCGIWACIRQWPAEDLQQRRWGRFASTASACLVGVVEVWGHVRVPDPLRDDGYYRGEFGRIIGLCDASADSGNAALVADVARRYGVPVVATPDDRPPPPPPGVRDEDFDEELAALAGTLAALRPTDRRRRRT